MPALLLLLLRHCCRLWVSGIWIHYGLFVVISGGYVEKNQLHFMDRRLWRLHPSESSGSPSAYWRCRWRLTQFSCYWPIWTGVLSDYSWSDVCCRVGYDRSVLVRVLACLVQSTHPDRKICYRSSHRMGFSHFTSKYHTAYLYAWHCPIYLFIYLAICMCIYQAIHLPIYLYLL